MPHPILSAVFAKYFTPDLYAPLSRKRKQIRVLDLYPAQEPEDPLKGALRRVRLRDEEVGAYETISYVWGDPHIRGSISLNKRLHSIPLTAAEALRRMRYTDRRRTLWIDSVCINQADMLERERQVAMMGQVFSHGQGNLIYLGAGSEDLYRGLDDIHKIYDEMMEDTIEFEDIEATRLPNNDPDHSLLSSNSKTYTTSRIRCLDDYSYIEELFDLPWFSRVWVIQEAALSRDNTCIVGPATIPLQTLSRAATWMDVKINHPPGSLIDSQGKVTLAHHFDLIEGSYGKRCENRDIYPPASWLLTLVKQLDCSDDRDRVFSILGLLRQAAPQCLLTPNYTKPVRDVLRNATLYVLSEASDFVSNLGKHQHTVTTGSRERSVPVMGSKLADSLVVTG